MDHWVMAFVGDHARENHEVTRRTNTFCVSSNRTPIRRAHPGDSVLFYVVGEEDAVPGEGFGARPAPVVAPDWSSKKPPSMALSVTDVQPFPRTIPYKFSGDGNHPILGFHRYSLAGGFLAIPEIGFEDVLGRAGQRGVPAETEESHPVAPARPEADRIVPPSTPPHAPEPRAPASVEPVTEDREREKRAAGQHAMSQGRKRVALWTVAEMGASLFGIERARKFSRDRARTAEQTWLKGGRAEERVGEELEGLGAHGFYIFHDVQLPGVGNVDNVVLGESGFFAIETKSHAGHVTIRGGTLLGNGRPFEKDFVKQAWSVCYGLCEILGDDVAPLLLFTDAFVEGRITARGVRVLPLK